MSAVCDCESGYECVEGDEGGEEEFEEASGGDEAGREAVGDDSGEESWVGESSGERRGEVGEDCGGRRLLDMRGFEIK